MLCIDPFGECVRSMMRRKDSMKLSFRVYSLGLLLRLYAFSQNCRSENVIRLRVRKRFVKFFCTYIEMENHFHVNRFVGSGTDLLEIQSKFFLVICNRLKFSTIMYLQYSRIHRSQQCEKNLELKNF